MKTPIGFAMARIISKNAAVNPCGIKDVSEQLVF
jgi:hypothetical protein